MTHEASLILLGTLLLPESTPRSALRIIAGRDATPGEYPFAVAIQSHYKFLYEDGTNKSKIFALCSGAALSPTWILTAAHCLTEPVFTREKRKTTTIERNTMVRYGNPHMKPSENNEVSALLKIKTMKINFELTGDDIALGYTEPFTVDSYARISAIDYEALFGQEVALIGFGEMSVSPNVFEFDTPYNLDKPLQIIDKAMLRSCDDDDWSNLCVVPACGEYGSIFFGDSGAPVLHASGVVGIVKNGLNFNFKALESMRHVAAPYTAGLTPVSPHINWIFSVITSNEK